MIGLAGAQSLTRLATPSAGSAGTATSVGGENLIAYDLDGYSGRSADPTWISTIRGPRPRAFYSRRPAIGGCNRMIASLVRLVVATTGLAQPDAERRVDEVAARARENISRARKSAGILAFSAAAAALLGAAAAWFAACAGGRVRDAEGPVHVLWD
jgi:hypothetical protein